MEHNRSMPFFFLVLATFFLRVAHAGPEVMPTPTPAATAVPRAEIKAGSKPETKPEAKPTEKKPTEGKAPEVKAVTVTRVVGEVGPRVVTSREVRINEAISQVLQISDLPSGSKIESKRKILNLDDPSFPAQVLKVLDEWTVYLEAVEIGSKSADKGEVGRLSKVITDHWKGVADWERLEASSAEIREIVERKLAAQSLEKLKGDASLVNVSDAEALQYFKKNRLRFGNLPFENFKDNIKSALVRSQTERRLVEWRSVLRRKYRVRNFVGA